MKVGDLVRMQRDFADPSSNESDWIGIIISHLGTGGYNDEHEEYVVQWSHTSIPAFEHGYYLEVIA